MRSLCALLILPLLPAPAARAQAETAAPAAAAVTRTTLDLQQIPLRRGLELMLQKTSREVQVEEGVPDVPVTVSLQDVPLRTAVKRVVAAAGASVPGLGVDFSGTTWKIGRGLHAQQAFRGPATRVALDVMDVPLREAVDRLFASTDSYCLVDANVPDVPVSVKFQNVSLDSGAWLLLGAAWSHGVPLDLKRSGPNYQVGVSRVGPAYERASRNLTTARPKRGDMRLHYVPLRKAAAMIPARPGTRVLVDRGVPDVRVRMGLRNLRPETAVSQLVAVSSLRVPQISYVRSGNVFVIYRTGTPAAEQRTVRREAKSSSR